MQGDFVKVVVKERIFINYINIMFPYDSSATEVRTMRRGSFFWLKELYNGLKAKDATAMRRAYSEFVRLYVLMDGENNKKEIINKS